MHHCSAARSVTAPSRLANSRAYAADRSPSRSPSATPAANASHSPASALAPLLQYCGKRGFVVVDMPDLDSFSPIETAVLPAGGTYLVEELDRGDHMVNWSPDEALPAIAAAGRTPLTLEEGMHSLLQQPKVLERGRCFMTIASRLRKPDGSLDSRTPALWISNGTGRDGRENRNAPKV